MEKKPRPPRSRQAARRLLNRFEGISWDELLKSAPALAELGSPDLQLDTMSRQELDLLDEREQRAQAKWENALAALVRKGEASIEGAVTAGALYAAQSARKQWIREDAWRRRQEDARHERRCSELRGGLLPRCQRQIAGEGVCGMLLGAVTGSEEKVCIRCDADELETSEGSAA